MLTVHYKLSFFRVTEIFGGFSEDIDLSKTDVLICSQLFNLPVINQSLPAGSRREISFHKKFNTLFIDLRKDVNELFSELHKNTRAKITKAQKDKLNFIHFSPPTDEQIQELSLFYDEFAKAKGIRRSNKNKMRALRDRNALVISLVSDHDNRPLCYHAYAADGTRATLLYSASRRFSKDSAERNLVGRANRYLHWQDIVYFKDKGYLTYDFCGFDKDSKDPQVANISQFKKGFGGKEWVEYKFYRARSFFGKLVLLFALWKWKRNPSLKVINLPIPQAIRSISCLKN